MEKEQAIQCVPAEMLERLKALGERLWNDKNPAAVHLNAVIEEFEPDIKALGHIIKEYETDYSGRLAFYERGHAQKEGRLKEEVQDCSSRLTSLETAHTANLKKIEDLKAALTERDSRLAELKAKTTEDESVLNSKYVAKMQELYDRVNRKELEMMARWEEKNRSVETRIQGLESDFEAKAKQFKLRELAQEEDFKGRKAELFKTFERIRLDMEARERALSEREAKKIVNGKPSFTEEI